MKESCLLGFSLFCIVTLQNPRILFRNDAILNKGLPASKGASYKDRKFQYQQNFWIWNSHNLWMGADIVNIISILKEENISDVSFYYQWIMNCSCALKLWYLSMEGTFSIATCSHHGEDFHLAIANFPHQLHLQQNRSHNKMENFF